MRTWITSSPIARPNFIIMGDFNAKVGSGEPLKSCTGAFGLGRAIAEETQSSILWYGISWKSWTHFSRSHLAGVGYGSPQIGHLDPATGVRDIIHPIRKAKHRWAGNIARLSDNRWTIRATEWTPRDWTRKQGRPRWRDDLTRQFGPVWSRLAKHRHLWDQSREGFLFQDWIQTLMMIMIFSLALDVTFKLDKFRNVNELPSAVLTD